MSTSRTDPAFFGTENIKKLLLRLAPPVMLSELILALYNICDSGFVGHDSADGLTALAVIFPIQFMVISFALGTGIGVNTLMAKLYAKKQLRTAGEAAGAGGLCAFGFWVIFCIAVLLFLEPYVRISTCSEGAAHEAMVYGRIVCFGSLPQFMECIWTKVHQAGGNMHRPMFAQIAGAVLNVALDPVLIFGWGPVPSMGIAGAAIATVAGQMLAAAITFPGGYYPVPPRRSQRPLFRSILRYGYPQVLRYLTMTCYIIFLNLILAKFSDAAVTVLGLYYKMQTFFLIPFSAFVTCMVPVLSYNYTRKLYVRCRELVQTVICWSVYFVLTGVFCFDIIPGTVLRIFTTDAEVMKLGVPAFRIIGLSLIPLVYALLFPTVFQAIGQGRKSVFLSLMRQIFTLLPFFYLFSLIGVGFTWIAFPVSETLTGLAGLMLYRAEYRKWSQFQKLKLAPWSKDYV